jgi:hypothetical protein
MKTKELNKEAEGIVIIRDREAADTLIDPKKYRYLTPFLRQERSLSEAAKAAGVASNLMHYQVQRLLRLDLLREVGVRQGRGRQSRLYKVSAQRFFIPLEYTSLETMQEVLYQLQEPLLREMINHRVRWVAKEYSDLGMGFELAENGSFDIYLRPASDCSWHDTTRLKADDFPAMFSRFMVRWPLEPDRAKLFQQKVIDLFECIAKEDSYHSGRYHLHLAIVPLLEP